MAITKNLGVVSPVPADEWNSSTTYQKLNIVSHNNGAYIAKQGSTGIEPGVTTNWQTYWMLLVDGSGVEVLQTTGDSETAVMSQKAVTDQIKDILEKIDYVAPTIATLTLTPSTSQYKLPATFTLTAITHRETNVSNLVGNLTLKRGSTVLKSDITPSETGATVTVSDTVTLTTSGVTYTLSGTDKKGNTISKTVSVSAYYTSYFGASEDSTVSGALIVGLTDTNSASLAGTRTVTITGTSKYVWFISTKAITSIKSSGFDVPFTLVNGSYSYNGTTYKCYRTTEKVVPGDNTFVIV